MKIKNIFIKTYGCTLNVSDSLTMKSLLKSEGYNIVDSDDDCDAVIINSCTVKNSAEKKLYSDVEKFQKKGLKNIILAGCVPQAEKNSNIFDFFNIVGVDRISQIPMVIKCIENGYVVQDMDRDNTDLLDIPKKLNDVIEIVPISKGCVGHCTYCKVKQARGELFSYDKKKILNSIKKALNSGSKEIWLTSQDTGAYGLDKEESIVSLLEYILKNTPLGYKIRLGMANPNHMIKYLDSLLKIFEDERLYKFLHIPLQSGSNRILKLMNRKYNVEDFEEIVSSFLKKFPNFTIATDIIVGFPTESSSDFKKSYDVIKKYQIPVINISRFWPRPDTPAEKLEELDVQIVKERTKELMNLHKKVTKEFLEKYRDVEVKVLVNEKEKEIIGRTENYLKVLLENNVKMSEFQKIKITQSFQWHLRGKVI